MTSLSPERFVHCSTYKTKHEAAQKSAAPCLIPERFLRIIGVASSVSYRDLAAELSGVSSGSGPFA
ncbi:MAG: hypothetical protein VB118_05965 [Oscillospiraceae bacterium]|nr:hypothetical protein [Oscillospiraceae bacterium]